MNQVLSFNAFMTLTMAMTTLLLTVVYFICNEIQIRNLTKLTLVETRECLDCYPYLADIPATSPAGGVVVLTEKLKTRIKLSLV